jgi:hypothetical protein
MSNSYIASILGLIKRDGLLSSVSIEEAETLFKGTIFPDFSKIAEKSPADIQEFVKLYLEDGKPTSGIVSNLNIVAKNVLADPIAFIAHLVKQSKNIQAAAVEQSKLIFIFRGIEILLEFISWFKELSVDELKDLEVQIVFAIWRITMDMGQPTYESIYELLGTSFKTDESAYGIALEQLVALGIISIENNNINLVEKLELEKENSK